MLGICNGFQVLCEAGLLPGALLPNDHLKFVFRQVTLDVVRNRLAVHARVREPGATQLSIPVKHTTGRYYAPDDELRALERSGQVLLRYAPGPQPQRLAA